VPVAAALVAGGLPPGAALVFLMAGPATNVATIGAVHRALGRRALAVYLGTIACGSVALGLAFDLVPGSAPPAAPHVHGGPSSWATASAVVLLGLLSWFAIDDVRSWWRGRAAAAGGDRPALELPIDGMTCEGCVGKLERALRAERGVESAFVTLVPARAVVCGAIDRGRLCRAVERAGFRVGRSGPTETNALRPRGMGGA
jgi:copper chaperone CopZ